MHYLNKPAPQTFLAHHGIKGQKLSLKDLHSTVLVEHSLIRINLVDCMLVTGKPMRRAI